MAQKKFVVRLRIGQKALDALLDHTEKCGACFSEPNELCQHGQALMDKVRELTRVEDDGKAVGV